MPPHMPMLGRPTSWEVVVGVTGQEVGRLVPTECWPGLATRTRSTVVAGAGHAEAAALDGTGRRRHYTSDGPEAAGEITDWLVKAYVPVAAAGDEPPPDDVCGICLGRHDESWIRLRCGHTWHARCLADMAADDHNKGRAPRGCPNRCQGPIPRSDWERIERLLQAEEDAMPGAVIIGRNGGLVQALADHMRTSRTPGRIHVFHLVAGRSGDWSGPAAVAAAVDSWGSRATQLLDKVQFVGPALRAVVEGRPTMGARVIAGALRIGPEQLWMASPPGP